MTFHWQKIKTPLAFALAIVFAIWLYWPTLTLPLIYDSLLHIRITNSLGWGDVWLPNDSFGFFRPMTFVPLLLVKQLFGTYPAGLLHAMNVGQHALNVGLIIWLGQRIWGEWRQGFVAGLLFAAFPFSYQAVAVYGHNVHPTIANLILLGLHGYLSGLDEASVKRPFAWLFTIICFLFALLTHESAILFGAFAALLHWTQTGKQSELSWQLLNPRRAPWVLFLVAGIFYLIAYQFLPIQGGPQAETVAAISYQFRALYLLQAAVYPLAWFGMRLGLETAVIITLSIFIYLLLLYWLWRTPRNRYPLLLGVGWWGLASLLIGLPLSTDYLLRGPRLLYLGGVGVCLVWGMIFTQSFSGKVGSQHTQSVFTIMVVGILTAVLIINSRFIRQKEQSYAQLTAPVQQMSAVLEASPESGGLIFINLPQWFNNQMPQYPVGVELVSMLGGYLFIEELVLFNTVQDLAVQATFVAEQFSEAPYTVGIHEQTPIQNLDWSAAGKQHLFLTTYLGGGPETRYLGHLDDVADGEPIASFGAYTLIVGEANACQDELTITLQWQHDPTEVSPTTTMFVQLLGNDGQVVQQADGPPFGIRADLLQTERPYTDIRTIKIDQPATRLLVGVYDFSTNVRFPARDEEERPLENDALSLPIIQNCPQD